MAINLSDSIRVGQQKPVDDRYLNGLVPYSTITEAKGLIPVTQRYPGLTINIGGIEHWWHPGEADFDSDPVIKTVDLSSYQLRSEKGQIDGYAGLDSSGKVPITQLPDSIVGGLKYGGTYNGTIIIASDTYPELEGQPLPVNGYLGVYFIATDNFNIAGTDYFTGDWVLSNGDGTYQRIPNADAVTSVFGRIGNILATEGDYQSFYPRLSQSYNDPSWINQLAWGKITGTPNTLSGYGITLDDPYLLGKANVSDIVTPRTFVMFAPGAKPAFTATYAFGPTGASDPKSTLMMINHGHGSTLDADMLDGKHGSEYALSTDVSGKEDKSNKVTSLNTVDDITYPTSLAVGKTINSLQSMLSNDIATKANLTGGNTFTGNQTINGNIVASGSNYLKGGNLIISGYEYEDPLIYVEKNGNQISDIIMRVRDNELGGSFHLTYRGEDSGTYLNVRDGVSGDIAVTSDIPNVSNKANTDGSNASGTWPIDIIGNSSMAINAINWGGYPANFNQNNPSIVGFATYDGTDNTFRFASLAKAKLDLNISDGSTLNNSISGNASLWNGATFDAGAIASPQNVLVAQDGTASVGYSSIANLGTSLGLNNSSTLNNNISGNADKWGGFSYSHTSVAFMTALMGFNNNTNTWQYALPNQVQSWVGLGDRTNWADIGSKNLVVGQLSWSNYNNGHTILDISSGRTPDTVLHNSMDAESAWGPSFPVLVGWNGTNTFGVRVDSARACDWAVNTNETLQSVTERGNSTTNKVIIKNSTNDHSLIFDPTSTIPLIIPSNAAGTLDKNMSIAPFGGNVGIGTTNPGSKLYVNSINNNVWATVINSQGSTNAHGLLVNINEVSNGIPFQVYKGDTSLLRINNNGTSTFGGNVIIPTPIADDHAATKKYVDDAIVASGGATTGYFEPVITSWSGGMYFITLFSEAIYVKTGNVYTITGNFDLMFDQSFSGGSDGFAINLGSFLAPKEITRFFGTGGFSDLQGTDVPLFTSVYDSTSVILDSSILPYITAGDRVKVSYSIQVMTD